MKKLILIILAVLMLSGCAEATALTPMSSDEKFNRHINIIESQEYQVRCFIWQAGYAGGMDCQPLTPPINE